MRIKISIVSDILEYLIILFMILDFHTPYSTAIGKSYPFTQITAILIVFLFLAELSKRSIRKNMLNRWSLYFVPYYICEMIVLFLSTSRETFFSFMAKFLVVFPGMVILFIMYVQEGDRDRFLRKFSDFVTILAAISLLFWIFGSQLRLLKPTNYIYAEWGGNYNYPMWFGVYTERQYQLFPSTHIMRNQGIFNEGPMYNFVLIVALAYEVFLRNNLCDRSDVAQVISFVGTIPQKQHTKIITMRIVLLSLTVLSTMTTTGIILMIMIVVFRYMINRFRNNIVKSLKPMLTVIIVSVGLYLAIQVFLQKSTSHSWQLRADDLRTGFLTFLSSPIWGTGIASLEGIGGKRTGFSNSIMAILSQGGILFCFVYFIPMIGTMFKSFGKHQYNVLVFTVIILLAFAFTAVTYTFVMLILIAFFNAYILDST